VQMKYCACQVAQMSSLVEYGRVQKRGRIPPP
jgi:hypothetical protein